MPGRLSDLGPLRGSYDDITPYARQDVTLPVQPQSWWGGLTDYADNGYRQLSGGVGSLLDLAHNNDVRGLIDQGLGAMEFATPYKRPAAAVLGILSHAAGMDRQKAR